MQPQTQVNINDYVWVQLTETGEKVYEASNPQSLKKKLGEWSRFQMWELMACFGNQCFNGGEQLFKENILRFTPPDL